MQNIDVNGPANKKRKIEPNKATLDTVDLDTTEVDLDAENEARAREPHRQHRCLNFFCVFLAKVGCSCGYPPSVGQTNCTQD